MPSCLAALWHYLEFLPGVYPVTNARAWGINYYYKDRPTWFQEISLYFYEGTRTRTPPYCFEYMITLVKADDFTTNIQSSNWNSTSVLQRAVIAGFTPRWLYAHGFVHCALPVFIIQHNLVAPNYHSLYSKKQIKVDFDTYFVCKVGKVTGNWSVSGKPVAELYGGLQ